jgi:hypothetical protein
MAAAKPWSCLLPIPATFSGMKTQAFPTFLIASLGEVVRHAAGALAENLTGGRVKFKASENAAGSRM